MTQSNESNDRRIVDLGSTGGNRQLRTIARRVNRLEDTQVTWGELNVEFDRLYDEIDEVKSEMTQLKTEMNQRFDSLSTELNGKIDIILRHITASGNS